MINKIQLLHGDSLILTESVQTESIRLILTDPPYGESMGFDGDENITTAIDLLSSSAKLWNRILKPNGFAAVFWASRSVDLALDVLRENGLTFCRILNMYLPRGGARPYKAWLPRTQPILLMKKYLPKPSKEIHSHLCSVLNERMSTLGISRSELAKSLNCNSRLIMKWTRENDPSWCLPTPRFYIQLKVILGLGNEMDYFLTRDVHNQDKRKYTYKHDTYVVNEDRENNYHVCQKPLVVLNHLVESLTDDEDDIVFDPFMGSGTTGIACVDNNRRFIGIEKGNEIFMIAKQRIEEKENARLHRTSEGTSASRCPQARCECRDPRTVWNGTRNQWICDDCGKPANKQIKLEKPVDLFS